MADFAVFGGTGFLGRCIVEALLAEGHRVRVVARSPEAAGMPPGAVPVQADILRPETVAPALEGADGAVNAVSLYLEHGEVTFQAVHVDAAARLAEAARAAGLDRYVHVSGIGADAASADPFIRSRGAGEAAVREACPYASIVRPSVMVGEGDAIRSTILRVIRHQPVFPLFGRGDTRLQPVHRADVAAAIARLLTIQAPAPLYEFGGAETYRYERLVREVARAAGQRVWPVPVPFLAWRALALVAERLPGAPLTRSQVALVRQDNVSSADLPNLGELGITPTDIVDDMR